MAAAPGGRVGLRRPRSATAGLQAPGRGPATPARLGTAGAGVAPPTERCRRAAAHLRVPRAARRLPPEQADGETLRPGPARPRRRSAASLLLPPPHARARRRHRRRHPARARARPARPRSWGSAAAANQRARARAGLPPPLPPPPHEQPPPCPPPISGGGGGEGALSAAPPRRAPARPGLPRSPHPPARHRGLGAAARTSIAGSGRGHRPGRDGAAPQCLPRRSPPPPPHAGQAAGLRTAAERAPTKWSPPGPAPRRGTRAEPVPVHRSAPLPAPVPAGGQRGGWRGSPPAPAGLGLPPAIVRRAPRAGPAPSPRSPAALPRTGGPGRRRPRGCRAEPCEPCRASPAGERRRVPAAWLSSPGSAAPGQPRSHPPSRRRAARTGPAPARSAGTGCHRRPPQPARGGRRLRRYLRCGPGSPPPAARVRAPRRAAAAPARLGRHGAGGSRGSAGMWHRGGAARAARGAGPRCRPPGCRRGARRGAARADPLPPPPTLPFVSPPAPTSRPCGSPRPCWRRAPPAGLGPGAAALRTQAGSARCPGLAAPQAQLFPAEMLSWSGCGLAPQRGTEDLPPPCLRTLAAPLRAPAFLVPLPSCPCTPSALSVAGHSTPRWDTGVQGLSCLGSDARAAPHTRGTSTPRCPSGAPQRSTCSPVGIGKSRAAVAGCPQTHFPSAVSPLPVPRPGPQEGPCSGPSLPAENREMASRPLPPAPARMCGTPGSVAGPAASGLCLRAAARGAGAAAAPPRGSPSAPTPPSCSPPAQPRAQRYGRSGRQPRNRRYCGLPLQAPVPAHRSHPGAPTGTARCPRARRECIPGSRHGRSAPAGMPEAPRPRTGGSPAVSPREMRSGEPHTPARREPWPVRIPREPRAGWAGCESPPAADVRRGGAWGERGPRGQHRDPAQRAGGGGWNPWPWGWIAAGSVGERVKESRRAGGGLARPRERKEAEEERSGEHPARRVCLGPPFPQEAACVA
ncbi:basic proline-rich protein-like [Ammospiza caudacuta]|uniref:basic proline-rich protein-like n=1 Tax=Ammospiza caudacuta TaxID=2857398 RepID=UPI0027394825|nr:basic proline-rich protein-like [Ammospiza caudacuta]